MLAKAKSVCIALVGTLCCLSAPEKAVSMPSVGDTVTLSVFKFSGDMVGSDTVTNSLTAYSPATGEFNHLTEIRFFDGHIASNTTIKHKDELMSDTRIEYILSHCEGSGQKKETLRIRAGTFEACRFNSGDSNVVSTTWIGRVPFGILKDHLEDREQGASITREVVSFQFGPLAEQVQ